MNQPQSDKSSIDVSNEVMNAINNRNKSQESNRSLFTWDILSNPFPAQVAAAMVIGVLIGAALSWFFISEKTVSPTELLSGTMGTLPSEQSISFVQPQTSIKLIPYLIDQTYYLNFIVDVRNELFIELTFDQSIFSPISSSYLSTEGSPSIDLNEGSIKFSAYGKTSFQVILNKAASESATITAKAIQNQTVIFTKQLNFN